MPLNLTNFTNENLTVLTQCKTTYITQTMDQNLVIALFLILVLFTIQNAIFEFKIKDSVRGRYERFFKKDMPKLQDGISESKQ